MTDPRACFWVKRGELFKFNGAAIWETVKEAMSAHIVRTLRNSINFSGFYTTP